MLEKRETLKKVKLLADKLPHLFIATADAAALPHVAPAGRLTLARSGGVALADWFCPATVTDLQQNPRIALVV